MEEKKTHNTEQHQESGGNRAGARGQHDRAKEKRRAYRVFLLLGVRVDSRPVLGAPVAALPVDLRGVDAAEEDVTELLEGHLRRVVEHLPHRSFSAVPVWSFAQIDPSISFCTKKKRSKKKSAQNSPKLTPMALTYNYYMPSYHPMLSYTPCINVLINFLNYFLNFF